MSRLRAAQYRLIAASVAVARQRLRVHAEPEILNTCMAAVDTVARELADSFGRLDNQFRRELFLTECGVCPYDSLPV